MEICSSTILDFTRALHVSTGISYYYGPLEGATQDIGHRTGTGHEHLHFVMRYNGPWTSTQRQATPGRSEA